MREQDINGAELVDAKHWSEKRFQELIQKYRKAGASDREIFNAMRASRAMIDPIGPRSAMRTPRVRHGK
jgi:hypothetical protein